MHSRPESNHFIELRHEINLLIVYINTKMSSFSDQSTSWAVSKTDSPSLQLLAPRPVHFSQMPNQDYLPYPALHGSQVSGNQITQLQKC